jgi:thiol-disulfide isomerase/thioredoxin
LRRSLRVAPLAAALALAALASRAGLSAAVKEGDAIQGKALTGVVDMQGRAVDLAQEIVPPGSGGGAALMVFWGTWCPPCIQEIPVLNELQRYYGKKGLRVIGLGLNVEGDTLGGVVDAVARHGIKYPVLFDRDAKVREAFDVRALPASVLIDGRGIVRWFGPALPKDINARIEAALAPREDSASK